MQTGLSEPLGTDKLLRYEVDAGEGHKVKVKSAARSKDFPRYSYANILKMQYTSAIMPPVARSSY